SALVYPGAQHTRFHHALGSMYLMQRAIQILRYKNVSITVEEEHGLLSAILLHDIGHGPFSHALEHSLIPNLNHEQISLLFMKQLNKEFNGQLEMGLQIFKGKHPKKFLNQLVSSQLDMDRLDYLKRDSFYTGVAEGNISSERLLTMLNVANNELVVEEKGLYPVEKFLMARRFMYWQVYLHKTSLVAEVLLIKLIQRAKHLIGQGNDMEGSTALTMFLKNQYGHFTSDHLEQFAHLDDVDILSALKTWQNHSDFILSDLSKRLLNRELLKIKVRGRPIHPDKLEQRKSWVMANYPVEESEIAYYVFGGEISNQAYNNAHQNIHILTKNGKLVDVAKASDHFSLKALSNKVVKYYVCYPKASV
ncbi:MAG: HD domain-containing protein, partial [Bacteroidota bacterium]